jgi:hypothetical protein
MSTGPADPLASAWAAPALEIDEDALLERAPRFAIDHSVRVMAQSNRLALVRDPTTRHSEVRAGTDTIDVPLRCEAHADPSCRFRWVRVTIDLSPTTGAVVQDLSPRGEIAGEPVKITTTYHGGLTFHLAALQLGPELSGERSTERDVYFPTITSSGIGLTHAIWDFTALADAPLHVDRELRLLASVPAGTREIPVQLTLRALVVANGLPAAIPLIGRQRATVVADDTLDTATPAPAIPSPEPPPQK